MTSIRLARWLQTSRPALAGLVPKMQAVVFRFEEFLVELNQLAGIQLADRTELMLRLREDFLAMSLNAGGNGGHGSSGVLGAERIAAFRRSSSPGLSGNIDRSARPLSCGEGVVGRRVSRGQDRTTICRKMHESVIDSLRISASLRRQSASPFAAQW
jgi:hypothetical protein